MFLTKKSSEKSQLSVKNIVTINAYENKKYQFKNDNFKALKKLSYNKSNFNTAYLSNKDIISTIVSLSRSIPEEDIPDILDIKAYEELGLDQANEYVISFKELHNDTEEREFYIFVADPYVFDKLFSPIRNQIKFIDLVVPAPLLYKTLYNRELLSNTGTDCFLYFTKYDAFLTLYKNGEYLYSKSIDFSLEQIYDKYCEIVGEKVDEKEFFTILESEGLKTTDSEYQQNFMKIFSEIFITINDIIIYTKRAFQLENIDKMYIGTGNGAIIGLDEYCQNYLGVQTTDLNFNYNINNNEHYIDQLQYMLLLSSFDYMDNEESLVNLTIYPRAPSFVNRAGGQFLIATFAAITVGLAWPLSYLVGSYINDTKILLIQGEDKKLQKIANDYRKKLGDKQKKLDGLKSTVDKLSTKYSAKTETLNQIYKKKVNYRLKSAMFHDIAEELDKFDVKVEMLSSKEDTLYASIVSSTDRKFTELIKYISDKHFNHMNKNKNKIDIKIIEKDPLNNYYRGLLKVELK